jgi:hypothetical protein
MPPIEPVRRRTTQDPVAPIPPVRPLQRRRREDGGDEEQPRREPPARRPDADDDDGRPHVDVLA